MYLSLRGKVFGESVDEGMSWCVFVGEGLGDSTGGMWGTRGSRTWRVMV